MLHEGKGENVFQQHLESVDWRGRIHGRRKFILKYRPQLIIAFYHSYNLQPLLAKYLFSISGVLEKMSVISAVLGLHASENARESV